MKVWLLSLLGLALFLAAGGLIQRQIHSATARFEIPLQRAEAAVAGRDWRTANSQLHRLEREWSKTKSLWAMLLNHKEIDSIEQALERSKQALASRSASDAAIELGALRYFLKHIYERERLTWVNIF
jgi:hypothetical protein